MNPEPNTICPQPEAIIEATRTGDTGIAAHIEQCPRCKATADRLTQVSAESARAAEESLSNLRAAMELSREQSLTEAWPLWETDGSVAPEPGQIWLAFDTPKREGTTHGDRSLVLVVEPLETQFGQEWVTVVGVDDRPAAATDADARFEAHENTLRMPIRARTDYRAPVERQTLSEKVGDLNRDLLDALVEGRLDLSRFGRPLEQGDWRGELDRNEWRTWWARRDRFDSMLMAAEQAVERCWSAAAERWWDSVGNPSGGWRSILSALPEPGGAIPSPDELRRVASGGQPANQTGTKQFWPVQVGGSSGVEIEALAPWRVRIKGLPASLTGLTPVVALPMIAQHLAIAPLPAETDFNEQSGFETIEVTETPELVMLNMVTSEDVGDIDSHSVESSGADGPSARWAGEVEGLLEVDSPVHAGETTVSLPPSINPGDIQGSWIEGAELLPPFGS